MKNAKGEHAFKRSPAYVFWSIVWAVMLAAVGLSRISGGALWLLLSLGAAACFVVNAWWSWRTPYIRSDSRGLTAYPAIVGPRREVAWSAVQHVRTKADGRLYLLGQDDKGMSIRMKTVRMEEREALVREVASRTGRRLLPTPVKPAKRPLLPMPRKPR
jgi:hypothetical protein